MYVSIAIQYAISWPEDRVNHLEDAITSVLISTWHPASKYHYVTCIPIVHKRDAIIRLIHVYQQYIQRDVIIRLRSDRKKIMRWSKLTNVGRTMHDMYRLN